MLKKIGIGVAGVVVLLCGVIAAQPDSFHIERSVTTSAAPAQVAAQVSDFHAWQAWSPWEGMDPTLKRTYSGAPAGVGAVYAWAGDNEVGEGRMTIQESDAQHVSIKLEFFKPFAATNAATFTFASAGQGTKATWAMDGKSNFVSKAFGLVMNMDKVVGAQFEQGLAKLKTASEAAPAPSVVATP